MDVGFRGEQDHLAQSPATQTRLASPRSPGQLNLHHRSHHQDYNHHSSSTSQTHDSYPGDSFLPANQIDSSLYAATHPPHFATNDVASHDPFLQSVDPDDFYRNYRGVQPVQTANAAPTSPPMQDAMASPSPHRDARQLPDTRIPTDATSPRPSASSSNARNVNGSRIATRSASNTIDDRATGSSSRPRTSTTNTLDRRAKPPSVKDLKKRFDQTNPSPSSSRQTPPRPSREPSASGQNSYMSIRTGAGRESGSSDSAKQASRSSQRPRYVAEDQTSSNSQSFASRISRPRNATVPEARPSKSMSQLSPGSSPQAATSPAFAVPPPSRVGLLFGEILPENLDEQTLGFGIDVTRPRRTSESHAQMPTKHHIRSLSDPDVDLEPSSPTDWYRGATPQLDSSTGDARPAHSSHSRSRNHGDTASRSRAGQSLTPSSHLREKTRSSRGVSPASRLPVSVRKSNSSPQTGSVPSTRSNSPATLKPSGGRSSRQHGPPPSRAKTPTSRANTPTARSKTPTHTSTTTRKTGSSHPSLPTSGRLNAYVTPAPPPKLSPSLRSSRPRQSVATATTAASRRKVVDRGSSPTKTSQKSGSKEETSGRRRKISVGPIDFAQRRETIKLAYSKSIRETQAKEASRAAAEKRKKELETVARIKLEAEAAALAAQQPHTGSVTMAVPHLPPLAYKPAERHVEPSKAIPLKITTDLVSSPRPTALPAGSPTLGIPGSFPGAGSPSFDQDEVPPSAISTTTAVTEFDIEPQTEPPVLDNTNNIDDDLAASARTSALGSEASGAPPSSRKRISYHYPFDEEEEELAHDEDVVPHISLDNLENPSPQLTPTRSEFDLEPQTEAPIPGSYHDEYEPQPFTYPNDAYETTVTILGPGPEFRPLYEERARDAELLSYPLNAIAPTTAALDYSHVEERTAQGETSLESPVTKDEAQFRHGPRLHENIAALRESVLTSSDIEDSYEIMSADGHKTPETSRSLSVPAIQSPNRLSQNSAWTDFSIGSSNEREGSGGKSPAESGHDMRVYESRLNAKSGHAGNSEYNHGSLASSSFEDVAASQPISPLDGPSAGLRGTHRLPDLEIGSGFSVSYPSGAAATELDQTGAFGHAERLHPVPQVPDHDPPPPPINDFELDRASYEAETRPSSSYFPEGSDELTPSLSTPHSAGNLSLDAPESQSARGDRGSRSAEMHSLSDHEQKRLKQRQHVIRELIDTEALFIRDMSVVEEIYKGTAEACPKLDSKTIKLIFRNTDEIIGFHTTFLAQLKEGVAAVYAPKARKNPFLGSDGSSREPDAASMMSSTASARPELDDEKDRQTCIGPLFSKNIEALKTVHEAYLRASDSSTKRLVQIQEDPTVMVWLNECNEVARDLTSAWNLDSLLIKPMQRITKYPDIITHLLKYTPADHPDRESLTLARSVVVETIDDINKTKKNFELVGQIVSRKRKDSDVRAGLARAFGKRVDKIQAGTNRPAEDEEYAKLHEKFGDDYLRLQVVLRDVEFYTRTVSTYVHEFLQYLSSMELVMRLQPSKFHAHLESKWVQFNVSMRDIEKIALDKHLSEVRKHVIEPFEQVIRCYGNPSLAMKKRAKRRVDYEKYMQLKANGKKIDKQLAELVEQYDALNDALKKELPKLSSLTAKVGNICLGKFVSIQTNWFAIWQDKVKAPLQDASRIPEFSEIVTQFNRDFRDVEEEAMGLGILNPSIKSRSSQSTTDDAASTMSKSRSRPGDLLTPRDRGLSVNSDSIPSLPTPDFGRRTSGQFAMSPTTLPSPGHYYRDYYAGINNHARKESASPITSEIPNPPRPSMGSVRPTTGRSYESGGAPRQSTDSAVQLNGNSRRDSNSTFNSGHPGPEPRRLSGLFHSALPLPDNVDQSQRSSRASSRDRGGDNGNSGYTIMWLAASLFEFNIETTKHEAGYPYLTYQAGEIFDVIAEKGELWLAKNQDDPNSQVGWIWSKHFAKLADS